MFLIKGRQFLIVSTVLCILAVSAPLTQRILAKIHFRTISAKMKSGLGALLAHFVHISAEEFEAYIINGPQVASHSVQSHLKVCRICREEIAIVRSAIANFESQNTEHSSSTSGLDFQWNHDGKVWINDQTFTLKPMDAVRGKALVEGLSLRRLSDMIEEDTRCPGTYFLTLEIGFKEFIAPLSEFRKLAPDKMAYIVARQTASPNSNHVSPAVRYASQKLGLQIIGNGDDSLAFFGLPGGDDRLVGNS